jgi:hypothetical protein
MTFIPKYRLIVSGATLYFAFIFSGDTDAEYQDTGLTFNGK